MRLRPLVGLLGGAILGILAFQSGESRWLWAGELLFLVAAAYYFGRGRRGEGMLLIAVALCGGGAYWRSKSLYQSQQKQRVILAGLGAAERLVLRVEESTIYSGSAENKRTAGSFRMIASILGRQPALSPENPAGKISGSSLAGIRLLLYLDDPPTAAAGIGPGDLVAANLRLQPLKPRSFGGGFSLSDYHLRLGVSGSAAASNLKLIKPAYRYSPRRLLFRAREGLIINTLRLLPGERGEVLAAVLFGYRRGVSPQTRANFRRTGTGHLLAISGLHVGLVVGLAWFFFRKSGASQRASATAAIIICLLYLGISGARPSAVRAAIMAIVYLGGFLVSRRSNLLNALACAALIILFHNPAALTDAGFLLSFTAVIFLSRLGYELQLFRSLERKDVVPDTVDDFRPHRRLRRGFSRLLKNIWGLFLLAAAAWVGLWPLSAYYFKLLAFSSLFLNILVIPWLSVVLLGGLLLQAAAFLPAALAGPYATACALPVQLLLAVTTAVGKFPYLVLPVNPPAGWAVAVYYSVFFAFFIRRYLRLRSRHFILPGIIAVTLIITSMRDASPPPEDRITVLRAGWGECAIIEPSKGEPIIIGHLPRSGRDAVDYLRGRHRGQAGAVIRIPDPSSEEDGNPFRFLREQYGGSPEYAEYILARETKSGLLASRPPGAKKYNGGEVPGTPGLRVLLTRGYKGRLLAWTIDYRGMRVTISENWWASSLMRGLAKAGLPATPQATILRLRDKAWPKRFWLKDHHLKMAYKYTTKDNKSQNPGAESQKEFTGVNSFACGGPVFIQCNNGIKVPWPFVDRRKWGALRLLRAGKGVIEIKAYNGEEWVAQ